MALALRYTGSITNPRGVVTEIDIYQEGYTGDVQSVDLVKVVHKLQRRDNVIYWGVAIDTVEVTINDVDKRTAFSTIFGLVGFAERSVELRLNNGAWKGWLKTKSISYDRYLAGSITLTFAGGLSYLEQTPYLTDAGNRVRGRDTYMGVIKAILDKTGQDAAGFNIASEWFTRFGANELTGTLPEPLLSYMIDRAVFWDEDAQAEENDFKGLPLDMLTVLSQLAVGSQLRIFLWDSAWWIIQRKLDQHLLDEDTVRIWVYPNSLSGGILDEFDYTADIDLWLGGDIDPQKGVGVTIEEPIRSTSITYLHRRQSFSLLGNPYFTEDIQDTGGDAVLNWKPSDASVLWAPAEGRGEVPYSPGALRVPVQYYIDPAGFAGAINFKAAVIGQIPKHAKQIGGYIEGGAGRQLAFAAYIRYAGDGSVGLTGNGYTAMRIKVGTHWVIRDSSGAFSLTESPTGNDEYLLIPLGQPSLAWIEALIPAVELFDGVDPISGNLEVYLHEVTEDYNGTGTGRATHGLWDDLISLITNADGTVFPEATQTTCADATSTNIKSAGGNVVLFGSGPTQSHRSRLTSKNSLNTEVEITSNFQVGNNFAAAATGWSRDALWCDELLRQTQVGLTRVSALLDLTTGSYSPIQVLRDNIHAVIVTATAGQSQIITTGALMPLRTVDVDGETNRVTYVNLNSNGTYTIGLESPLGSTHTGIGILATQKIRYTWDSLAFDLIEQTVAGEWTELYDGAGGDTLAATELVRAPSLGGINASGASSGSVGYTTTLVFNSDNLRTVDAIADLASIQVGTERSAIMVRAFSAATGLGGGLFVGDPSDTTTTADGGTVVTGADGKKWKRVDMVEGKPWSPTWFGARFDVSVDDAPAWQATVNAAPYGSRIIAPPGRGMINSTIVIDGKIVSIEGASESYWADTGYTPDFDYPETEYAGTKLYSGPGLTGSMFKVMDEATEDAGTGGRRNAVTFKNLHLIGNLFAGPNPAISTDVATDTYGIEIVQGWGVKVIDVNIVNFTDDGLIGGAGNITTSDVCHFERLNCAGNGGWGVQWNGADSWFLDCRFNLNTLGGALVGSSINTFQSCRFDLNVGPGARANGAKFNRYIDCVFDTNQGTGLTAGDGTINTTGYQITGCIFANNGKDTALQLRQRAGLWVFGGRGWTIANNVFVDQEPGTEENPKRQTYGLYLSDGWRDHRITGSVFSGNTVGTTNLRSKNIEGVYNVLEHGVEQNTVDCSPALQELIDGVVEGATLYFPEGNYYLLSTLVISKSIRLQGQSTDDLAGNRGAFIQAASTLDGPCISISDGGVVIEKINFLGSLSAPSTAATGIEWVDGTGGRVDRCVVTTFRGPCIKVGAGAANIWIQNSVAINSETNGILIQGSNCQVSGGEARQNGQYGIYSLGASDTRITDNFVWDNGWDGIIIQDGQRAIVTGNTVRANLLCGIRVRSGSRHLVHSNTAYGNGLDTGATGLNRAGIAVIEGDRLSVCHNHCGTNSGGAQQYGISFGDALTSAMVLDNTFEGNAAAQYLWNATSQPGLDIDLSGRATINFGSIAAGAVATQAVTLNGVVAGDAVMLGPPSNWNTALLTYAIATSANTVTIVANNSSAGAIDPPEGEWQVLVSRRGGTATAAPPPATLTALVVHHFDNPNLLQQA